MSENRFEVRYQSGDIPWDHDLVDQNLVEIVSLNQIKPCRTLDVGCGTGLNAIWLAEHGFEVSACDLSPTAIRKARSRLNGTDAHIHFFVADFLDDDIPGGPFGFVFDRGCLHCMDGVPEREAYVTKVAELLEEDGCWLTLVGNADEGAREVGPPQLQARELVEVVETRFEIKSLVSGHFGSDQVDPPWAWICLMRKRSACANQ